MRSSLLGTPDLSKSVSFGVDDRVLSLSYTPINGSLVRTDYSFDALGRRTVDKQAGVAVVSRHYVDGSDSPGWVVNGKSGSLAQTDVFTPSLGSGLSVVRSTKGGSVSSYVSVSNLHGDTVTSLFVPSSGFVSGPTELNVFDEYGVQQTPAVVRPDGLGARFDASALFLLGYESEGAGKRETTDSGLMFMGVRAFNPVTGQFLSQDPVSGGNETAYNYPNDPINKSDLTGGVGILVSTLIEIAIGFAFASAAESVCPSVILCIPAALVAAQMSAVVSEDIETLIDKSLGRSVSDTDRTQAIRRTGISSGNGELSKLLVRQNANKKIKSIKTKLPEKVGNWVGNGIDLVFRITDSIDRHNRDPRHWDWVAELIL